MAMLGHMGQTNTNFAPGANTTSAGSELSDAGMALLNYLDASGVPSEHVSDPNVVAFQTAWNADPANSAASAQLSVDGGYGPNVHDALAALVGSVAPAVNTGASPTPAAPATPASPLVTPTPATPTAPSSGGEGLGVLLLIGAALVGGWLIFGRKKKVTHHHAGAGRAMVEVRSNPRRRRRSNLSELIP